MLCSDEKEATHEPRARWMHACLLTFVSSMPAMAGDSHATTGDFGADLHALAHG
jgi:hypothetical protein